MNIYTLLMVLSCLHGSLIASQTDSNQLTPSDHVFSLSRFSGVDGYAGHRLVRSKPIDFSLYRDEPEQSTSLEYNAAKPVASARSLVQELHHKKKLLKCRLKTKKSKK